MRFSLRIAFPISAAILFGVLSFATTRQAHVLDRQGWGNSPGTDIDWEGPVDIGTPADVLLLALYLPALVALLPLSPITYWVDSEVVLRAAWCISAIGQWFLIGRYFDIRRGLISAGNPNRRVLLHEMLFGITIVAGSLTAGMGLFEAAKGHSLWGLVMTASVVFWGLVLVVSALRWRSSSSRVRAQFNPLRIS